MNGKPQDKKFQKPFDVKKEQYNQTKWNLVNSPEYARMSDDDRTVQLNKFFDTTTSPYLKYQGLEDAAELAKMKEQFIAENLASTSAKKKHEDLNVVQYQTEKEEKPEWDDILPEINTNLIAEADVTAIDKPDDLGRLREAREAQSVIAGDAEKAFRELINDEEFGYIKNNPGGFLSILQSGEKKRIERSLEDKGYDKKVISSTLPMLQAYADNELINKERQSTLQYVNIPEAARAAAKPFIDDWQEGTFLDPETGKHRKPETAEESDIIAYMQEMFNSVPPEKETTERQDSLTKLYTEVEKEGQDVEALRAGVQAWVGDRENIPKADFMIGYWDRTDKWKKAQFEYIKNVEDLNIQVDEFTKDISQQKPAEPGKQEPKKTPQEVLDSQMEDSFVRYQYWKRMHEDSRLSYQQGKMGNKHLTDILRKYRSAEADFQASSLMAMKNVGPMDIKREDGFYSQIFGNAVAESIIGPTNMLQSAVPIDAEIMRKLAEVGNQTLGLTDTEFSHIEPDVMESVAQIGGHLAPDIALLMMLGGTSRFIKSASGLTRLKEGYQIIRNPVIKTTGRQAMRETPEYLTGVFKDVKIGGDARKAAKMVIGLKDPIPTGWEVIKQVNPTRVSKAKAVMAELLLDEAIFSGLGGFTPGAMSGMNAAHTLTDRVKLKGKYGKIIEPFLKSGFGATVGMEAGALSSAAVDALLSDKEFKDTWDQQWGNMSEASKRVMAEMMINSLVFGSTHLFTTATAKKLTDPLGGPWYGYLSPKYRSKVSSAAREAESLGMTDTAEQLQRWLDTFEGPMEAEAIKKERILRKDQAAATFTDPWLQGSLKSYENTINLVEGARLKNKFPAKIEYTESGKSKSIELENRLQANILLEDLYENRGVFNFEMLKRQKTGKFDQGQLAEGETPQAVALPLGRGGQMQPDQTIAMRHDPERQAAMQKAEAFEGNRFGTPEEALKGTIADFRQAWTDKWQEVNTASQEAIERAREIDTELAGFKGRKTLEQRKEIESLEAEKAKILKKVEGEFNTLEKEYVDVQEGIYATISEKLKKEDPTITDDQIDTQVEMLFEDIQSGELPRELLSERPMSEFIDEYLKVKEPIIEPKPLKPIKETEVNLPELATANQMKYDGVQKHDGTTLEQFTIIDKGPAHGATFNIAQGATKDEIIAKRDQVIESFKKAAALKTDIPEKPTSGSLDDTVRWVAEHSTSPTEVLSTYEMAREHYTPSVEPWQEELLKMKVAKSSLSDFGDPNKFGFTMMKNWVAKKDPVTKKWKNNEYLDIIAQELSETHNKEITPDMIAEFIMDNPSKSKVLAPDPILKDLSDKFKDITGLNISKYLQEEDAFVKEIEDKDVDFTSIVELIKDKENIELITPQEFEAIREEYFSGFPFTPEQGEAVKKYLDEKTTLEKEEKGKPAGGEGAKKTGDTGGPEVKPEEQLKADLDEMSGLLDEIDIIFGAPDGKPSDSASEVKIGQIATGIVNRFADRGVYSFSDMMKKTVQQLPQDKAIKLLPYLKQGYGAYSAVAPDEIADKMDIKSARSFRPADLDQMYIDQQVTDTPDDFKDIIGKKFIVPGGSKTGSVKSIEVLRVEQWDATDPGLEQYGPLFRELPPDAKVDVAVINDQSNFSESKIGILVDKLRESIKEGKTQPYPEFKDSERYSKLNNQVADLYLKLGNSLKAEQFIEAAKGEPVISQRKIEDGRTVPNWEVTLDNWIKSLNKQVEALKVLDGEVIPVKTTPRVVTDENIIYSIDSSLKRPIAEFAKKFDPLRWDQNLKHTNEIQQISALAGMYSPEVTDNFFLDRYTDQLNFNLNDYMAIIAGRTKRIALKYKNASPEKLAQANQLFDKALKEQQELLKGVRASLVRYRIKNDLINGRSVTYNTVKALLPQYGLNLSDTQIRDLMELAFVERFRDIARDQTPGIKDRFNSLVTFYNTQPSLGKISSQGRELQQYSTPGPLAFMMNEFINGGTSKYIADTTAGNGMLLAYVDPTKAIANEIAPSRYTNLKALGIDTVTNYDASKPVQGSDLEFWERKIPAITINPPFGSISPTTIDGFKISKLEHLIAKNALDLMSDDGKAGIIVGGHMEVDSDGAITKDLPFYNWLFRNYAVDGIINVDGNLYSRMGTNYPVRLILIGGRKPTPEGNAPLLTKDQLSPALTWGDVFEKVNDVITKPYEETILRPVVDEGRGVSTDIRTERGDQPIPLSPGDTAAPPPENTGFDPRGEPSGATKDIRQDPASSVSARSSKITGLPGAIPGATKSVIPDNTDTSGVVRPDEPEPGEAGAGKPGPGVVVERPKRKSRLSAKEAGGVEPYRPFSKGPSGGTVLPRSQANEMEDALRQLSEEIGDVDDYVLGKLEYPSKDDLFKAFYAEQIDALAMSLFNIDNGEAVIIGDQTGVGKGRVAAGVLRYANKKGYKPVFMTKDANLYSDIYRDLTGIGSADINPFIFNRNFADGSGTVTITDPQGREMYRSNEATIKKALSTGTIPGEFDASLVSYSQLNTDKTESGRQKRELFRNLVRGSIIVMDESHLASGQSSTGEFIRDVLQEAAGATFLSATYAKRPDNLPLYSVNTVIREAAMTDEELSDAINIGGPALMEIISSQLVESMQLIRRERSMAGVVNNWVIYGQNPDTGALTPEGKEIMTKYDAVTSLVRDIIDFQSTFVKPLISAWNKKLKAEGKRMETRKGTSRMGVQNYPYFNKVYNVINQLLFSLKAQYVVPDIIDQLKQGQKPFIAFSNTMEAMFKSMVDEGLVSIGDEVSTDFSYILEKGLKGVMRATVTDITGKPKVEMLDPAMLGRTGQTVYYNLIDKIKNIGANIPASPIDIMIHQIEKAGYKVAEITGRKTRIEFTQDDYMRGKLVSNPRPSKNELIRRFNNEPGWVILGNVASSTGLSAHASVDFKDQSQRVMTIVQPEPDINAYMQKMGRIHRAGQVTDPMYNNISSVIPAEKRMLMMTRQKIGMLDANTTSNQRQSEKMLDIVDFLNKYGDQVIDEYLRDNPDINNLIGDPLGIVDEHKNKPENPSRKVTNEISILPTQQQEEFYDDVIDRYTSLIAYLNETDQNDLEVKALDLQAKVVSKDVVIRGRGGYSAFGDDSSLELTEVKSLKKPFTSKEIDGLLAKELQGILPEQHAKDTYRAAYDGLQTRLKDQQQKANTLFDARIKTEHEQYEADLTAGKDPVDAKAKRDDNISRHEESRSLRLSTLVDNSNLMSQMTKKYIDFFTPGKVLEVPFEKDDGNITRMNKGIAVGYDINQNKANPWVPSNINIKFVTADSRKSFKVPMSKGSYLDTIIASSYSLSENERQRTKNEWDSQMKHIGDRVKRYIVTGNILQAFRDFDGRLIEYTTEDGLVRKGLLLPDNFNPSSRDMVTVNIIDAKDVITALKEKDFVMSRDNEVSIIKGIPRGHELRYGDIGDQLYTLRVPFSREKGAKYWDSTKSELPALMIDGEFVRINNTFNGIFAGKYLDDVLKALDKYRLSIAVKPEKVASSNYNAAEAVHGQESIISESVAPDKAFTRDPLIPPPDEDRIYFNDTGRRAGRISPAPLYREEPPKKVWEIQMEIPKQFRSGVRYQKTRKGWAGYYSPAEEMIVLKYQGDLDVTAHELGHRIDDMFGIVAPEFAYKYPDLTNELSRLWKHSSKSTDTDDYRRAEGVAEYVRAWLINPERTEQDFPILTGWMKERIPQDMLDVMKSFGDEIRAYVGSTWMERGEAHIGFKLKEEPEGLFENFLHRKDNNPLGLKWSFGDKLVWGLSNDAWPVQKAYLEALKRQGITSKIKGAWDPLLTYTDKSGVKKKLPPSENPLYLGSLLAGHNDKMMNIFTRGMQTPEGKVIIDPVTDQPANITWLLEDLDRTDRGAFVRDINRAMTMMVAQRSLELEWKLQGDQVMYDLQNNKDMLPPLEILKLHPQIAEKYAAQIDTLISQAIENNIPDSDLYFPDTRYDFSKNIFTGIGGGFVTDRVAAENILSEAKANKENYARWNEFARKYRFFGDNLIEYAVRSGLMTRDAAEYIRSRNMSYIALQRMMVISPEEIADVRTTEDRPGGRRGIGVEFTPDWMHRAMGSGKAIKDPLDQLLYMATRTIQESDYNNFKNKLFQWFVPHRDMYSSEVSGLAELARRVPAKLENSVGLKKNGVQQYWQVDPVFYDGMMNVAQAIPIPVFTQFANAFRASVVLNPAFYLKNLERDIPWVGIIHDHSFKAKDWLDPATQKWAGEMMERMGGGQFGWHITSDKQYYALMKTAMNELIKDKGTQILNPEDAKTRLWDNGYMKWLKSGEKFPRRAVFASSHRWAKKHDLPEYDALVYGAAQGRRTMDYAVAGYWIRKIAPNIPFLNPKIRGLERSIYNLRHHPKGTLLRLAAYSLLTTALQTALLSMLDDSMKEEYFKMPAWRRDLFFNFPTPWGGWLTLPRAFDLGILSSAVQRAADGLILGDDKPFDGYLNKTILNLIFPFRFYDLTSGIGGLSVMATKKDFFRDKYIIPPSEQKKNVNRRNTQWASQFGKDIQNLSEWMNNLARRKGAPEKPPFIDARMVDAFVNAQFTYFGKQFLDTWENIRGKSKESRFGWDWSDTGQFKYSDVYGSVDVQWIMKTARAHDRLHKSEYTAFTELLNQYFDIADHQERQKFGTVVLDYAENLRSQWEERDFFAEDEAKKKKEKSKTGRIGPSR